MNKLNGEIHIESEVEKGTQVTFHIKHFMIPAQENFPTFSDGSKFRENPDFAREKREKQQNPGYHFSQKEFLQAREENPLQVKYNFSYKL